MRREVEWSSREVVFGIAVSVFLIIGSPLVWATPGSPQDGLEMTATGTSVEPGETAQLNVTIENTRNETIGRNYTLSVNMSTLPKGWTTNATAVIIHGPLEPNETRNATFFVHVSSDTAPGNNSVGIDLGTGSRMWKTANATVEVVSPEETRDEEDDEREEPPETTVTTTTEENNSEGGGAPVVVASSSDSKLPRILVLIGVVLALAFLWVKLRE